MLTRVPSVSVSNISKIADSRTSVQNFVIDESLTLNNYMGTPHYRVQFTYRDNDYILERNIIIDIQKKKGITYVSAFLHLPTDVVLLYNDNPDFPADDSPKTLDRVKRLFKNFKILKDE